MTRTRLTAVIVRDGRILMIRYNDHVELSLPGSKSDEGETEEECLSRMLLGLLNARLSSMRFVKDYYHEVAKTPIHDRIYLVTIDGEPMPGKDVAEIVWYSRDDFLNHSYKILSNVEQNIYPDLMAEDIF